MFNDADPYPGTLISVTSLQYPLYVQRPSKGWSVFFQRFRIRSVPDIHFPQCPRLKEPHLISHLDGAPPKYSLDRDGNHVEKLTYACNTEWIDYDIFFIQWFHGIRILVLC